MHWHQRRSLRTDDLAPEKFRTNIIIFSIPEIGHKLIRSRDVGQLCHATAAAQQHVRLRTIPHEQGNEVAAPVWRRAQAVLFHHLAIRLLRNAL